MNFINDHCGPVGVSREQTAAPPAAAVVAVDRYRVRLYIHNRPHAVNEVYFQVIKLP